MKDEKLNERQKKVAIKEGLDTFFKHINHYITLEEYTVAPSLESVNKKLLSHFWDLDEEEYRVFYKPPGLFETKRYVVSKEDVESGIKQFAKRLYEKSLNKPIPPNQQQLLERLAKKHNFEVPNKKMDGLLFELTLKYLRSIDSELIQERKRKRFDIGPKVNWITC